MVYPMTDVTCSWFAFSYFQSWGEIPSQGRVWTEPCPPFGVMNTTAPFDSRQSLYQAKRRSLLELLGISGDSKVRRSLNQMGLHVGDHVRVLSKAPFGGPVVIETRGGRVAIGKQLAERVRVQVIR